MTGSSLQSLKETAFVQTGGAHREAYKQAKGTLKSIISDPLKAQKAGRSRIKKYVSKVKKRLGR
jgi:hypothetical protein